MFVWSKRLVIGLLGAFVLLIGIFFIQGEPETISSLKMHTIRWMAVNYIGLLIWVFIWMFDRMLICQAIEHDCLLLTPDPLITQYPVRAQW